MSTSMEDMVKALRKGFDPLAHRLGLRGPTVVLENTYFFIGYFGEKLGLEVSVVFDYFFVQAMPFRVPGHDAIPVGFVNPTGRTHKMYLHEALGKLRIPFKDESAKLKRLGGNYRNCEAMTAILVPLVERTWTAILGSADDLFPV